MNRADSYIYNNLNYAGQHQVYSRPVCIAINWILYVNLINVVYDR